MNWVKVYNSLRDNPKILEVSDSAFRLYICSLCYANEHLTDGKITKRALEIVSPGLKNAAGKARELVAHGLWIELDGGGWEIHDYTDVQRSAAQVKEIRRRDRERKQPDSDAEQQQEANGIPTGIQLESNRPRALAREEKRREELTALSSEQEEQGGSLAPTVRRLFEYWQAQCRHPQSRLTAERRRKCEARLREGYTEEQGRTAIDGAARAAFVNDQGKRFDDFELIFRNGTKLESFIERAGLNGGSVGSPKSEDIAAAYAATNRSSP